MPIKAVIRYFKRRRKHFKKSKDLQVLEYLNDNAKKPPPSPPRKAKSYWRQDVHVSNILDRLNLFEYYCKGKKVLHVGCVDYPIFKPESNLHIYLSAFVPELHGLDLNVEGLDVLKKYVDQPYFSSMADVAESYDVCLIPEVIEHVNDIGAFLKDVGKCDARLFVITAPNAFKKRESFFKSRTLWVERIHPDHNCWFSPYTLKNVIEKYSGLNVRNVFLMNRKTMVCCVCSK